MDEPSEEEFSMSEVSPQAKNNLLGFFKLLIEWDQVEQSSMDQSEEKGGTLPEKHLNK